MAEAVEYHTGGISSLRKLLAEHAGAINYDLQTKLGITVWWVGRRFSWPDFRDFLNWLPPTGDSALWRARKPNSWWVTYESHMLNNISYATQVANRQRARRGSWPKYTKLPEDKEISVKSGDELDERRSQAAQHLKRRRAQKKKQRR